LTSDDDEILAPELDDLLSESEAAIRTFMPPSSSDGTG
jgi:hypothetical protein